MFCMTICTSGLANSEFCNEWPRPQGLRYPERQTQEEKAASEHLALERPHTSHSCTTRKTVQLERLFGLIELLRNK